MGNDDTHAEADQIQQLMGALDILDVLREEMEQWLEEAQDESKRECLENVLGHIGAVEVSYRHRLERLREDADG
jgi:hypothetical protein